jgi:hypothetical protein
MVREVRFKREEMKVCRQKEKPRERDERNARKETGGERKA